MQAQPHPIPRESHVPLYSDSLHDLVGPVNQISTLLELLHKQLPRQTENENELFALIQASATRLQALVRALQDFGRLTSSPLDLRACDCNTLLAAALASLDRQIRDTRTTVQHDALPEIYCDPSRIVCVLTGIIENALKFRGDSEPQIRISAASQQNSWIISIHDNGIGIDPRHHKSIFHMFRRVNGDRYSGCGAGLAIAHHIVENHGGRIWVESELGKGSTFCLALPADPWHSAC